MSPSSSTRPFALASRGLLALLLFLASLLAAFAPNPAPASAATVIYVTPGGTGTRDGYSWANTKDLQDALTAATSGSELWVKAGIYKPTTGTDRTATFQLKNEVAVYGGFVGTEIALSQRNWTANVVVLSGDIGVPNDNSDNSGHVVTGSRTDPTAILDGVTITAGNANMSSGGGVYNNAGSPTLSNVMISGNNASSGGGMYNYSSSPALTNVAISDNTADYGGGMGNSDSSPSLIDVTISGNTASSFGGGMYNYSSSPTLTHVTISGNTATSNHGGGMYNYESSSPTLTNVTISGNTASRGGGGMYNENRSSPTLTDVTISNNTSGYEGGGGMGNLLGSSPTLTNVTISGNTASSSGGGGMSNWWGSSPVLTNVTISGNTASSSGGGVSNSDSSPTLTNVTISGNASGYNGGGISNGNSNPTLTHVTISVNTASSGGGVSNSDSSSPTLIDVLIGGNTASSGSGGGVFNDSSNPTLIDVTISGNTASGGTGGGMSNDRGSSPVLTNVTISGNTASNSGGGVSNVDSSSPVLTNVTISGNTASSSGGGVSNDRGSSPTLTNVTISGNIAEYGGGVSNVDSSSPTLTNVTISGNTASSGGGGMMNWWRSIPSIRNSILWGNTAPTNSTLYSADSTPAIRYSLVQGSHGSGPGWNTSLGTDGGGNLDADPRFISPITAAAPTTSGDLRLLTTSAAIGAGDSSITNPSLPPTDRDGNPRIIGSGVDMGAYEAQGLPLVASIALAGPSPTNATSVQFTVFFNAPVSGVDSTDFALTTSGLSGPSLTGVAVQGGGSAPASVWTVTVGTGSGDGTLRLDLVDDDSITAVLPSGIVPLGGTGLGNGSFSSGPRYTFDKTAPDTTLDSAPPTFGDNASARFSFSGSDSSGTTVTFECRLDGGTFVVCTNPQGYSSLSEGSHTFQVRAKDAVGNLDSTPESYAWLVDFMAPNTTLGSAPPSASNSANATFSFSGSDTSGGTVTFECRLDVGQYTACTSPQSYASLSESFHTFQVRAKDGVGHLDSTPASHAWRVDVTAPQLSLPADFTVPSDPGVYGAMVSYAATASDGFGGSGAGTVSCSPASGTLFPVGTTNVNCSVADAAGNTANGGFRVTVEQPPTVRVFLPLVLR